MINRVICASALLLLAAGPAFAQADPGSVTFRSLFDEILTPVLVMVITGFLGWVAERFLGIKIQADHRESLQTALKNAAGLVLQKVGDRLQIQTGHPRLAEGVQYVIDAAPDALARFKLSKEEIAQKILAWLPQIEAPAPPAPVVVVEAPKPTAPPA